MENGKLKIENVGKAFLKQLTFSGLWVIFKNKGFAKFTVILNCNPPLKLL